MISGKSPSYSLDLLSNSCVRLQLFRYTDFKRFILDTKQNFNHKIFHADEVFMASSIYDTLYDTKHFVPRANFTTMITFGYYHGRLLSQTCGNLPCDVTKDNIRLEHTETCHIKVHYPPFRKPISIKTEAVEYPPGNDGEPRLFASIDIPECSKIVGYNDQSWVSSTFYHINCSKPAQDIGGWSGLDVTLISHICLDETLNIIEENKVVHLPMSRKFHSKKFILKPPYPDHDYANLWKLEISFQNINCKSYSYGHLVYKSNPMQHFCYKSYEDLSSGRLYQKSIPSCALLKTSTVLSTERKVFQYGFQKFQNASLIFYPSNTCTGFANILYKWDFIHHNRHLIDSEKSFKHINSNSMYSWKMAAELCKQLGMTLPHLQNQKSTMEFASYILAKNILPIYALFVGLVKKARF